MKGMELIRHRRSVRTFDGRALTEEDKARILEYARRVENPYDVPIAWMLLSAVEQGLSAPVIVGADTYITGKLTPVPHGEEAFGYAFERILLFAEAMGIGSTWIAGTMDRTAFERAAALKGEEVMPCVSPLGYPAEKMSIREGMMRKGVKADSRLPFAQLFFRGSFDQPLKPEEAGELSEPLEMVRWAPSAVNKQPWRVLMDGNAAHFFKAQSRGFVNERGWDLQKVDLGIALCHFAYGLETQGRKAELSVEAPDVPVPEGLQYIASFRME